MNVIRIIILSFIIQINIAAGEGGHGGGPRLILDSQVIQQHWITEKDKHNIKNNIEEIILKSGARIEGSDILNLDKTQISQIDSVYLRDGSLITSK